MRVRHMRPRRACPRSCVPCAPHDTPCLQADTNKTIPARHCVCMCVGARARACVCVGVCVCVCRVSMGRALRVFFVLCVRRYIPVSFNQAIGATTPFFTAVLALMLQVRQKQTHTQTHTNKETISEGAAAVCGYTRVCVCYEYVTRLCVLCSCGLVLTGRQGAHRNLCILSTSSGGDSNSQ